MTARAWIAIGLALLAAGLWYLRPVLTWHYSARPQLRAHPNAARLNVETVTQFTPVGDDWPELRVDNLRIRAPIRIDERSRCAECGDRCVLQLEAGTLAIFDLPPPESYEEVVNLIAPDEDDISPRRAPGRNWDSIDALAARVGLAGEPPKTFRFRTQGARGVVSSFDVDSSHRFVIYAYSPAGDPTRVVGVTGASRALLVRMLGSLAVGAASDAPAAGDCR